LSTIEIRNLTYAYPGVIKGVEPQDVLKGVDLTIEQGEFLALMGATGAGKSTLCMALNGLVPQSMGGVFGGSVTMLGRDTRHTPVAELAALVGVVYQDPESQLLAASVEDEVAFGPENLGLAVDEIKERIAWALGLVGMAHLCNRPSQWLSGGQKQRVVLAAVLAMLPQVLVLDEPTASLDPAGQREVFQVIEHLARERQMTILMVSHDAEQIAEYADRVAVLADGRIVAADTPQAVFGDEQLLIRAGIGAPQVSQIARLLREPLGTNWQFTRLAEAESALRDDLHQSEARS